MERLTFDGLFCDIAKCENTPGGTFCESGTCTQRRVWERLKEYEDTCLEPEEIKNALDVNDIMPEISVTVDQLRNILQAEQDGRLVMLPFPQNKPLLDMSNPENPELLLNFRVAIAYNHCGIVFHQPFNIFMENVERGYICQVSEDAEAALAQEGGKYHA